MSHAVLRSSPAKLPVLEVVDLAILEEQFEAGGVSIQGPQRGLLCQDAEDLIAEACSKLAVVQGLRRILGHVAS